MARTGVGIQSISLNAATALTATLTSAGATGSNGYTFTGAQSDTKIRIVMKNAGTATGLVFVQEGGYINGVAAAEISQAIGPDETKVFSLDGSKYRQTDASINMDIGVSGVFYIFQG